MDYVKTQKLLSYCKKRYAKNRIFFWCFWCLRSYFRGILCGDNFSDTSESCDILILHPSRKSFELKRKQKLIDKLRSSGINVKEAIALSEREIVKQKSCCGPFESNIFFHCYEGYANWLRRRFNPKIIITDRNGSLLSPFLKSRTLGDPITFHLAHAVLTAQSSRFSMLDYDYYCVYGQSSAEYLQALPYSFGSCHLVLGGSVLFDEDFQLPPPTPSAPLLFLGMGPELESTTLGQKIYELVLSWQKTSGRKLYVRLHQRSNSKFWTAVSQEGVEVLQEEPFKESAARASLILAPYTNAVVDAALLGRPVQLIAFPEEQDFLQVEAYFGSRVFNSVGLEKAVNRHLDDYRKSIDACTSFSEFHLEQGVHSVNYINDVLLELLEARATSKAIPVGQSVASSS
ncbi:MAG: hypothetical protein KBT53_07280 [Porticoccus sp.]|nr:hypothetical protein [Porticoccus sp.]MBQ0807943.1 hypothetical protein [Porticoccus sp.]